MKKRKAKVQAHIEKTISRLYARKKSVVLGTTENVIMGGEENERDDISKR